VAIGSRTRIKLAERAGWSCGWCNQKTRRDMGWQNSATIEHVTPVSAGGSHRLENLMSACARCNRLRGTQCVDEFMLMAQQFQPDRRMQSEALHQERKHNRKRRQAELITLSGNTTFSYVHVNDSELNAKERLRKDRTRVRQALKVSRVNPFDAGSRRHRMFERELTKLLVSPPSVWSRMRNKLTVWGSRVYAVFTQWEKARENRIWQ
jgi:hypothetical protein